MSDTNRLSQMEAHFRASPAYRALLDELAALNALRGAELAALVTTPPETPIDSLAPGVKTPLLINVDSAVIDVPANKLAPAIPVGLRDRYATSTWTQIQVLSGRAFSDMYRDPLLLRTHLLVGLLSGCTVPAPRPYEPAGVARNADAKTA